MDKDIFIKLLAQREFKAVRSILDVMNEVDIASLLSTLSDKELALAFRLIPKDKAAEVFSNMDTSMQTYLVTMFTEKELKELLDDLYMDDTVDMLEELPANLVKRILATVSASDRSMINQLLNYPEDSAGSIMTTEYVDLREEMTVGQAMAHIKKTGIHKETIYTCYITERRKLVGIVSAKDLMTALWTINLRLAGTANVPIFGDDSIFDNASVNGIFHDGLSNYKVLVIVLVIAVISKVLLDLYMKTKSGFLLRAVGDNDVLVTSLAKDQGNVKILGLAIANGLVALSGSIFCQEQRVFEISSGTGAIVIGLASVIIGTSLFKNVSFMKATTAVLIGSVIYKACVAAALKFFEPQDMKLITAVLFLVILVIGGERRKKVKKNARA